MRDYEFADPSIVRAVYHPDRPLEDRDMLLEGRFYGLRFHFGVRVGGRGRRDPAVDGRQVRVWGWNYRTLQGHLEMGQMDYEVWKWLDTGEVEFRIHAVLPPGPRPATRSSGSASGSSAAGPAAVRPARLRADGPPDRRPGQGQRGRAGPSGDKSISWRFSPKPLCRNDFGHPRVIARGPSGV